MNDKAQAQCLGFVVEFAVSAGNCRLCRAPDGGVPRECQPLPNSHPPG